MREKSIKNGVLRIYIGSGAWKRDLLTAAMGVLVGRVALFDGAMPFGVAYLSACGMSGRSIHAAVVAVLATMLIERPLPLAAIAVCAMEYALLMLFAWLRKRFDRFERLILLLLAQVALMPVFYRGNTVLLLRGVISMGVSVPAALLMQNALRALRSVRRRHVLTDGEQMSICAFFGVFLLSVADVGAFGFSLCVALLLAFAMFACYARGIAGVAAAVAIASVLTLGGGYQLPFVGSVAVCAFSGAALRGLGKFGVVGGFLTASLLFGTYAYTGTHAIDLPNLLPAGVVLLLLPKNRMLNFCGYLDANRDRERYAQKSMQRMRLHIAAQLKQTAHVIGDMAKLYDRSNESVQEEDAQTQWMAHAAFGVCVDCPLKKVCWKEYRLAARVMRTLSNAYARGETIRPCEPFEPACRNLLQMAAAACHAQNQYCVQQAMEKQQRAQNAFMFRQLDNVSGILDALAARITEDRWLDEELEETLLIGLDRRGFRVFGADAFFPNGKLMLRMRILRKQLYQLIPFTEAVQQVLRRPLRVLRTEVDGRYCQLVMEEEHAFMSQMGTASAAKTGGDVSGDCAGERCMERGRVLYALSDGMGTGEAAHAESDATLRLLFDLYEAGFSRDVALESVNRLLLRPEGDMYATLDAVHVDLRTGEAEFMKYGAPPSFIYRGKSLHPVRAEALPAGILSEAVPAVARTKLRHNDAIILFSDGALDALGERTGEAVAEALEATCGCEEAAEMLLRRARQIGWEDDMTVMVIRIA